jgi:hypothetical protein
MNSVGRGLMKKINSGYELAKEIGIPAEKLERIFAEYRDVAAGKKKDKWGKKFFHKCVLDSCCRVGFS